MIQRTTTFRTNFEYFKCGRTINSSLPFYLLKKGVGNSSVLIQIISEQYSQISQGLC
jgi:hypothetical protein